MFLDLVRARVHRELSILRLRSHESTWELARKISSSQGIPQSVRHNAPKLSYRAVEGFLSGTKSNRNTIDLIAAYLVNETGLPEHTFEIPEQSVKTAREFMRFARLDDARLLTRSYLSRYSGVYCLTGVIHGPVTLVILVDHETEANVLLARAILRFSGKNWPPENIAFLEGFVIPERRQLVVVLRNPAFGSSYTIQVSNDGELIAPSVERQVFGASVHFPMSEKGREVDFHQPTKYFIDKIIEITPKVVKYPLENSNFIDVFRDCYQVCVGGPMLEVIPSPFDIY